MTNDDKKYNGLISTLKDLQKVKAHPNFEADLKRKLNAEKFEISGEEDKKRFWIPSRLAPTFVLVVIAMVVFLLIDLNSVKPDNPFLIQPRVREDMIAVTNQELKEMPTNQLPESREKSKLEGKMLSDKKDRDMKSEKRSEGNTSRNMVTESVVTAPDSSSINEEKTDTADELSTELATGIAIRKSGLNFRQIKQSKLEKEQILELKKKVQIRGKTKDLK